MKFARISFTLTLALALYSPIAFAQAAPATAKPTSDETAVKPCSDNPYAWKCAGLLPERTFYLNNVNQPSDANEIVTALRNLLPPDVKTYLVISQNAIVVRATPEDIALAQKLLTDLDRPKKSYRLTYTVSEKDGAKLVRTQHYAMVVASGQTTTLKQGSKVPVVTGSYSAVATDTKPAGAQTQVNYIDVGMNFDATLFAMGDQAMLRSNLEQSSIAPEQSGVGPQDPIVRQSSLKGVVILTPGKPQLLGSMAISGSTSRLDIEVVMEPLP
jgi:type II secretory pathway component GspD/PulD (secretin)